MSVDLLMFFYFHRLEWPVADFHYNVSVGGHDQGHAAAVADAELGAGLLARHDPQVLGLDHPGLIFRLPGGRHDPEAKDHVMDRVLCADWYTTGAGQGQDQTQMLHWHNYDRN